MATDFGARLNKLRNQKGFSLEELAVKIGSTKSYIWDLENKPNKRPSAEMVYKLAAALDTTVDVLMGKKGLEDAKEADKVFFRNYQQLDDPTKSQLRSILDALKKKE